MTPLSAAERCIAVGLNSTRAAGLRELKVLRAALGSLAGLEERGVLRRLSGLRLAGGLRKALAEGGLAEQGTSDLARARELGLTVTVAGEEAYPERLLTLSNPPVALFHRGRLPPGSAPMVAVVGARRCSRYGERASRTLAEELSGRGVAVVSGLARGVDRAAHEGALAGPSETVAVLGCGLERVYPPEHEGLARRIAAQGALVSEFAPEVPPLASHFPRRNRLIAALADAVVLVEARPRSGGLITVRWAADLGREVFVVPGQIDSELAYGPLSLARDGARLVRGGADLCLDMGWGSDSPAAAAAVRPQTATAEEQRLLAVLDHEAVPLDQVLATTGQTPGRVLTILLSLELRGLVEQQPGLMFRRTRGSAVEDPLHQPVQDDADHHDGPGEVDEEAGRVLEDG